MTLPRPALPRLLVAVTAVVALLFLPVAPDALAGDTETYVAMGDSYTAGPGIPHPVPYPLGCWRSDRNYPHLVGQSRGSLLRDVSCSGATTTDLVAPQPVLGGPNPPQLDALDAEVGVVSLQIGGNDIGFAEIIQRCTAVVPLGTPCQRFYTRGGIDEISRRITETGPKVGAVLAQAQRRSPEARLFVLGYPSILPDTGLGCWPVMPIAPGDVPYLREKHKELNAMLATQAEAAGATYVDLYGPSVGHDACQLPRTRWVEPLVPLSPAAAYHPNALGMRRTADILVGALAREGLAR
ncbi:MAG TPA: SGNH/GDSL hydrolase family protein [Acidimicrobiales bacterium]|nr:SGNH/GDSL hydrolase family protein [Acidimicrobiales bacterium]